ncbi:diguanylate cyclase domain protein [Novosphingobium sp. Rr 2-17]|uniref:putative bifunctional diguanylate cyclase/phosphodiesterase n=1 Tax=Novosphingobium sp. Rr 2-17 TaxID=555793 RepID=UPI0002697EC1|nr:EAL domain-containing protein [Novosphingobium sp. Rr 2-17]EIZ78996.1 diguanylate cyclase domain protein [Novosphingobium sp. Rr 2-17]
MASLAWAGSADAQIVPLRTDACYAVTPFSQPINAAAIAALPFDCKAAPDYERYRNGWIWLKVRDPARLSAMPANWQLLTDQVRFARMVTIVVDRDGSMQQRTLTPHTIGENWALGGNLRVPSQRPGSHVQAIYVGYDRLDHVSLMRKLSVASPESALRLDRAWLGLMGVFGGAILSAFVYNLLIYTGQRLVFQRWYLVWSILALAYGLTWTNVTAMIVPGFAGPRAVSADYLLVAGLIAAGNMFFLSVIEEGVLPRWLTRTGALLAALNMAVGIAAWSGGFGPPLTIDRILNLAFLASATCMALGIAIAIRANSRVVWFYLAGWTPVLAVFALRVLRNFGLSVQADIIDMATFGTLAFESVALSLAIADRFRLLGKERDAAEQARKVIAVESETHRRAAHTDYLTGLGNRAAFHTTLRAMCEAADQAPFLLLLIDVDNLKDINDRLGHDGGDKLLEQVGKGLLAAGGVHAQVSRIGGDEFAVVLAAGDDEEIRLRHALEALQDTALAHDGRSWALSLSIGLARFPADADTSEVLFKNADLALYLAKEQGRRQLREYHPPLRAKLDSREAFNREAGEGIKRGEFSLHFQPIIDLQTGLTDSFEALLRWQHPVRGLMTPSTFGEMLNERDTGLVLQQHALEMALHALREYPLILPRMSVNLTSAQLDGPHAARRLLTRLAELDIAPDRLCIEVTEKVVLDRTLDRTVEALTLLHDAGVTVALDDFGTGYASLIHLKHLPFDSLKIDRSFTRGLFDEDGQSEEIIRAIIGLGQGLRKHVVAEGIETLPERQRLAEMGCRFGQGYLFARPAPIEALESLGDAASVA